MRRIRMLDVGVLPKSGVLRAAEVSALSEASEIIAAANAAAAAREASHTKQLEHACNVATERAYAEGLSGLAVAAENYSAAMDSLEEKLVDLLRECLERVFNERAASDVLKATITPVLNGVTAGREITVAVHPTRILTLDAALTDAKDSLANTPIAIEADSNLGMEDCRILTDSDVINVGVPIVIDRLIGALSHHLPQKEMDADIPQAELS